MALTKCKDCKAEISKKAKACPQCGAPVKKGAGLAGILVIMVGGLAIYAMATGPSTPSAPSNIVATPAPIDTAGPARDLVMALFKGDSEPTVLDAIWTSDSMFKVGVLNDQSNRDGLARYVCQVLSENGLGSGYSVEVVDIASIAAGGAWTTLGAASC